MSAYLRCGFYAFMGPITVDTERLAIIEEGRMV